MRDKIFPWVIALSALSVSGSAAFYSVYGLSKMFAGASLQVMIMAGSLEFAKLVIASLLHQYWSSINKILRAYLLIATLVLIAITSGGIYGFLSSAYSETSLKMENMDKQVELIEGKKTMFAEKLSSLKEENETVSENIKNLTNALSNNIVQYTDKNTGQLITTTSSANRKSFEAQLEKERERKDELIPQISAISDSISSLDLKVLELEMNSDVAAEIGPLKYIAELSGKTIDEVVNWYIIGLIFVFDPLAISLVVAANFAFSRIRRKEEDDGDDGDDDDNGDDKGPEEPEKRDPDPSPKGKEISFDTVEEDDFSIEIQGKDNEESPEERKPSDPDSTIKKIWEDWNKEEQREKEEWDEDHALDMVLNDMVEDIEEEKNEDQPQEVPNKVENTPAPGDTYVRGKRIDMEGRQKPTISRPPIVERDPTTLR
jgi:hypothetical protein